MEIVYLTHGSVVKTRLLGIARDTTIGATGDPSELPHQVVLSSSWSQVRHSIGSL